MQEIKNNTRRYARRPRDYNMVIGQWSGGERVGATTRATKGI